MEQLAPLEGVAQLVQKVCKVPLGFLGLLEPLACLESKG